jgi:hypothetical protein
MQHVGVFSVIQTPNLGTCGSSGLTHKGHGWFEKLPVAQNSTIVFIC